jgi:hypothetical protein
MLHAVRHWSAGILAGILFILSVLRILGAVRQDLWPLAY